MDVSMTAIQTRAETMMARHGYLGVPLDGFAAVGRSHLVALLGEGLAPDSTVLEIGCGCLRTGAWLVKFLDPGRYHGLEPVWQRVEYGLQCLLTREEIEFKRPRFDFSPGCDSAGFGVRFDAVIAPAVWSRAGKPQVSTLLDGFVRDSAPGAVLLTSYLPADTEADDCRHDGWTATSAASDGPGTFRHRLDWIRTACAARGLEVTEVPPLDADGQAWLRIRRG
jgi:hypothetical protein